MKSKFSIVIAALLAGCNTAPKIANDHAAFFVTEHTRDTLTVAECLGRYVVDSSGANSGQVSDIQNLPGAKRVTFQHVSNLPHGPDEIIVKPTSHATRAEWHVTPGFATRNVQTDMARLRPPC